MRRIAVIMHSYYSKIVYFLFFFKKIINTFVAWLRSSMDRI